MVEKVDENFVKTIYDPSIWTDIKLEKALKEALQYKFQNTPITDGKFIGLTNENYEMEFIIREGKVSTFYLAGK
jgi:hypothetical protein